MSRQLCPTHPDVDYTKAWGCPECVVELRKRNAKLAMACQLTLLFFKTEWSDDTRQLWRLALNQLLGPITERTTTDEATTKNLCDAIRAALQTTNEQHNKTTTI